jgi:chromosome segregation ATPase
MANEVNILKCSECGKELSYNLDNYFCGTDGCPKKGIALEGVDDPTSKEFEISDLTVKLSEAKQTVISINSLLNTVVSEKSELQTKLSEAEKANAEMLSKVMTVNSENIALQSDLGTAEKKLSAANAEIKSLKEYYQKAHEFFKEYGPEEDQLGEDQP